MVELGVNPILDSTKCVFENVSSINSYKLLVSLPNSRLPDNLQKYVCKCTKIRNWSHAENTSQTGYATQVFFFKDPTVWLDGAIPLQKEHLQV